MAALKETSPGEKPEDSLGTIKPAVISGSVGDELIAPSRTRKGGKLADEDEEEYEPIDASAPSGPAGSGVSGSGDGGDRPPAGRSVSGTPGAADSATGSGSGDAAVSGSAKRVFYDRRSGARKRRIKRSKGRSRDEIDLRKEAKAETPEETPGMDEQSTAQGSDGTGGPDGASVSEPPSEPQSEPVSEPVSTTASEPAPIPTKPSWMPEDAYKRQVSSIESSVRHPASGSSLQREYKVERDRRSRAREQHQLQDNQKGELVKNFYNDQTYRSRKQKRTQSKIYKLRSFNNCIKYMLILKYAQRDGNVLDLGCGKGGDISKWDLAQTASYVGIDISDQSIKEAVHRYRKSRCHFRAIFATGDCFNTPVPEIMEPFKEEQVNLSFDTASMQFCLHYAFAKEESARRAIENVSRSLKIGGMFIGTIPSSDFIRWKIKRLQPGEVGWGNSIYSVDFPEPPPKDGNFPTAFGNMYTYYLVDAVDHVPEYVVPFEKLRSLCEEYGLELRFKRNLFELFNKEIPRYFHMLPRPLVESLRRDDGTYGVSGEDKEACQFYLAFAFEKTG